MNFVTRFWHHFLYTRAGKIFLILILLCTLFIAVLSGISVWQLGTFEGWLTLFVGLSGVSYAVYYLGVVKKADNEAVVESEKDSSGFLQKIVELLAGIFPILFLVLILRSFLFEPFRIPSGSMLPTLHLGDFIIVNKYAYGLKLPVLGTKILPVGEPQRGDVIVFRFPNDESVDYIKRIVGVPGDVVRIKGNKVSVNNQLLSTKNNGIYEGKQWQYVGGVAEEYKEKSSDVNKRYSTLWDINRLSEYEQVYKVPAGHYFVLGDNRSNSNDSRYWGWVPEKNIKGKAAYVWLNWYDEFDFSRIGNPL